jgi:hypothetical protein
MENVSTLVVGNLDIEFAEKGEMEFEKFTVDEILERKENINPQEAANEVIKWLTDNVENFIDNKEKKFRIDLVIEENSNEELKNIKLLQDLYRGIKEDSKFVDSEKGIDDIKEEDLSEVISCRKELDKITKEIREEIEKSELKDDLFKRMVFFYELAGINNGHLLLKKFSGSVGITNFDYESFDVGVKVIDSNTRELVKKYVIPEGFSLTLEIAFIDRSRQNSLF